METNVVDYICQSLHTNESKVAGLRLREPDVSEWVDKRIRQSILRTIYNNEGQQTVVEFAGFTSVPLHKITAQTLKASEKYTAYVWRVHGLEIKHPHLPSILAWNGKMQVCPPEVVNVLPMWGSEKSQDKTE